MGVANSGLRLFQWGIEVASTHGTAVPATSKMAVTDIEFEETGLLYRPKLAKGLITRNPGNETVISHGTKFTIPPTPVIYDQHHNFCAMGVVGAIAASGAPSVYTWTYTRNILADPAIDSRTIERRLSDGTNFLDTEWAYAFLSEMVWEYEPDSPIMFSAEGFARAIGASTLTAGQAFPTIEIPSAALATLAIDTAWGGLGGTPIVAQILGARLAFHTGYKPKMSLDGRAGLDFTTHLLDAADVGVDLTVRMLIEADSGQYATERTAAAAGTIRAVRLNVTGTGSRSLKLDALVKHELPQIQKIGSEDEQDIVELHFVDATDATNLFAVTVINATNAVV